MPLIGDLRFCHSRFRRCSLISPCTFLFIGDPRRTSPLFEPARVRVRLDHVAEILASHRGDGKRFVVRADEKLIAFPELESAR